jgi:electron-transferring-flavoprotein dehydrogenase
MRRLTSPFRRSWKHHPSIAKHLEGGECISYGARCLNEGGWHSIPRLAFPGGALLGCAAGFLNSVKIKGTHGAIKSGSLAAESVHALFERGGDNNNVLDFEERVQKSWLASELKEVRNCSAAFHHGLLPGMLYTGLSAHVLKGREPWTLKSETTDAQATGLAAEHQPIDYPKPDGKLSFDLLSNLQRSGTNHEHDQPSHLRIKAGMDSTPKDVSFSKHAGPEQRFCPAQVYEYTE